MQNTEEKIYFNFSYFALKLLGKGLYNNPWNAIAELVANGLDAQATSVKLYINMSDKKHSTIEILDNGTGMDYDDLAEKYVFMGKDKRQDKNISEDIRNSYMGRKGIGKLAALYLSKKYYLITKTDHSNEFVWVLDTKMSNESDIPHLEKENINNIEIECVNDWAQFKTGTMIKLTDVDLTGIGGQTIEGVKARLADFFLLDTLKSKIEVCVIDNQNSPKKFQPVEKSVAFKNFYAFFNNTELDFTNKLSDTVVVTNPNYPEISDKKRAVQYIDKKEFLTKGKDFFKLKNDELSSSEIEYELKGWIGIHTSVDKEDAQLNDANFLKNKAYKPNQLRLYVRKKLAVENFFDIYKNNQVFANYIEGEISFDILDDDRFEDIATTNRQSLIQDDIRVEKLIELVKPIIGKLIRTRIQLSDEVKNEVKTIKEQEQAAKEKAEAKAEQERKAKEEAERKKKEEEEKRKKAEEKAKQEEAARKVAEEEVKNEKKRSKFIESNLSEDQISFTKKLHMIRINLSTIQKSIRKMVMQIQRNKFTIDTAWTNLKSLSYYISRAKASLSYSPYAKFDTKDEKIEGDLFAFIKEYAENILIQSDGVKIIVNNVNEQKFITKFSPQDIAIIIDNIASNTAKPEHKSTELEITLFIQNDIANIVFKDNGVGLSSKIKDINELFEFGKSYTESGTGIGLYHVKDIVENHLNGNVTINKTKKGFEIQIRI